MSTEERKRSRKLKMRCRRIIKNTPDLTDITYADVSFVVLKSNAEKKKGSHLVFAECAKIPDKDRWAKPYDFEIVVYEPNCDYFTDQQMDILLEHELRHIGIDLGDDEPRLYIVPHDIEEFDPIAERFGLHWEAET